MPLYHFKCAICRTLSEILLPMSESDIEYATCPSCGLGIAERQAEVCSMRPDSNWHFGQQVNGQYFNSSSQIARAEKAAGLVELSGRDDVEAMNKHSERAAKARDAKFSNQRRAIIEEQLTGQGLFDSFGQLRPEATRKLSDEEILDPGAQKRKKETITLSNE